MITLQTLIQQLESFGLADVLLPFLLIFSLFYIIILRNQLFEKNINLIISLVCALGTVIPHVMGKYPPGMDVVNIMNRAMPNIMLMLVAIVCFFLVTFVIVTDLKFFSKMIGWVIVPIIGFIAYTFITSSESSTLKSALGKLGIPMLEYILPFLVFALLTWFITRDSGKAKDEDIY